jgi:molecular chaperone DnaJ
VPTNQKRDCYEVLSVERSSTADEIKSAYRKAALKWHPDRNPETKSEAEEKFREATEAYSILSDPAKRATFDRFGYAGLMRGGFDGGDSQTIFDEFQDIFGAFGFEDIFGGRRSRSHSQRGADLRYDMKMSFEDAAAGVNTKLRLPRLEFCESCNGTGAKSGTGVTACATCKGRGQMHYQQGFFTISRTCPDCRGAGQIVRECCPDCRGQGRIERTRTIDLRIPAGVDSNTRLRVPGEGEPGDNGGPPGDLYVVLEVKNHPYFERRNSDLYCTVPISVVQAALGAEIKVPGLHGEETVKVAEGVQTGELIRLKGKGLPDPHGGGKGDLYVNIHVVTPTKLTREQRRLMEQLGATLPTENRPAQRDSSLFDKVKDIFG